MPCRLHDDRDAVERDSSPHRKAAPAGGRWERRALLALVLCAVAVLALAPGRALANAGSPHEEGDPVGEPSGALAGIAVERETLTLDLRPLASAEPAQIEATYHLRNDGAARTVELFFVATALSAEEFAVWVNDAPVPATRRTDARLPSAWKPPNRTPALTGSTTLPYEADQGDGLRFQAALGAGTSTLRVRYRARASAYSGDQPVRFWQLGYVLAPARDWASFDRLDVTVLLPPGWRAAADPPLDRRGDTLAGSFAGLPADTLALTAQAPYELRTDLLPVAALGGAAIALVSGVLSGIWLGRRRRSGWWLLPLALICAVAWTAAVLAAGLRPRADIPAEQDAWTYGYGRLLLLLIGSPFLFAAGLALTTVAGLVARALSRPHGAR